MTADTLLFCALMFTSDLVTKLAVTSIFSSPVYQYIETSFHNINSNEQTQHPTNPALHPARWPPPQHLAHPRPGIHQTARSHEQLRYCGDPAILYHGRHEVEAAFDRYDDDVDAREDATHERRRRCCRDREDRRREEELMAEEDEYERELGQYKQKSLAYQDGLAQGEWGMQGVYSSGYGRGRYDGYDDGYGDGYEDRSYDGYYDYDDGYDDGWDARSDERYGREADAYWGGWKSRAQHQGRQSRRNPSSSHTKRSEGRKSGSSKAPSRGRITWDFHEKPTPDGWTGGFAETIYNSDD
ncbi:hypothetical protein MMC34_005708 [Xylographa carneopallida]|nr:hypothetical protein [Xylographa carneopallida]